MPVLINEESHEVYSWESDKATIGRTPDNTVQIKLSGISRQHCRIVRRGVHHVLIDLGSKNGTRLNGNKLEESGEILLEPGDVIQMGKHSFRFEISAKATARKQAPGPKLKEPDHDEVVFADEPEDAVTEAEEKTGEDRKEASAEAAAKPAEKPSSPSGKKPSLEEADGSALRFADEEAPPAPAKAPAAPPAPAGTPHAGPGTILCTKCLKANLPDSTHCWNCKSPLPKGPSRLVVAEAQRAYGGRCPQCGTAYNAGTTVCTQCGMSLLDRRAVISSGYGAQRRYAAIVLVIVLTIVATAVGYSYFSRRQKEMENAVDDAKLFSTRLDRAEETFLEAEAEEKNQRYERALLLYKEAETMVSEVNAEPGLRAYTDIENRAEGIFQKFQKKRESYAAWLQENLERFHAEGAARKEAEEQQRLGRVKFHGGWIDPTEVGLESANGQGFFPEESALERALAAGNPPTGTGQSQAQDSGANDGRLNPLLEAFLRRAWSFQESSYVDQGLWRRAAPLPEPEFLMSGARGTRYPEGVTVSHFPDIYLARVFFTEEKKPPTGAGPTGTGPAETGPIGKLEWDEAKNSLHIEAVFHDSTESAEKVTQSKDVVVLSQNVRVVSSKATAAFHLPRSKEDAALLQQYQESKRWPVLQMVFKVSGIEGKSDSQKLQHTLDDGTHLTQERTHHDYTLKVEVLQSRWFYHLPDKELLYLPVFLEEEPKDGLYDGVRRAMGAGEVNSKK